MRFRKDVTDEELAVVREAPIAELMRHVVPARVPEIHRAQNEERRPSEENVGPDRRCSTSGPDASPLSDDLHLYLDSVVEFPNDTTTQRAQRLALSPDKSNRMKKEAIERGLAEEISLNLGQVTGGLVKLLGLSPSGRRVLGLAPQPRPENVSAEHWWWQRNICAYYRSLGLETRIEKTLNGKRADVGFLKSGRAIAVEVELSPKNAAVNVQQDLMSGFSDVLVACTNARARQAIEAQLDEVLSHIQRARVKVILLSEFSFVKRLFGKRRGKTALQDF